jgi:beta-glucanase (GH16 family)
MTLARLTATLAGAAALATGCAGADERSAASPAHVSTTVAPLWADEFDGAAGALPDARRWTPELGGEWGDDELQQYTGRPRNVSQDGAGHLVITADRERHTGEDGVTRDFTSARLTTLGSFSFQYGRVEARIEVPAGKGLIAGFWALGSDIHTKGWPEAGEIDVVEVNGATPRVAHGSLHGPGVGEHGWAQTSTLTAGAPLSDGFHTYAADWSPEGVEFSVDDVVYERRTPQGLPGSRARWTFDHPFHLLLTLSVGGPWAGAPDAGTRWPARMLVDWIRVWRP